MKTGLLLLTGGSGSRMGAPKHTLPHPAGGSWGGHLVEVFRTVFPDGPIQVLGDPLAELPDLPRLDDPREGPAVALIAWAAGGAPTVDRWWIVACDQVRWTSERLRVWDRICGMEDPGCERWVMALHDGHLQPLGGWLPESLRPALAQAAERSLFRLATGLPHLALPREGVEWVDVDTPQDRLGFEQEP